MSKYIDLLREHQGNDSKKETKPKATAHNPTENPYREQEATDTALIASIDELLDEQQATGIDADNLNELQEGEGEKLIAMEQEDASPKPFAPKADNKLGFDTSGWLEHVEQTLVSMFSSVQNNQAINISVLEEHLTILFDQIQSSKPLLDELEFLVHQRNEGNMDAYHHADLVAQSLVLLVYSIKTGLQLQKSLPELLPTVTASMLRHMGFSSIPSDERSGVSPFSDMAKRQAEQATQFALEYLETHQLNHEQLTITLKQYGEYFDGTGPQGLEGRDIAWVARLTSAITAFESLTSIYAAERILPRDAIRDIVKNHKKRFDSQIIKAMIDGISLYPVAIFIQLNTGEIGQVINVHPQSPLRPIVHISMDKHGQPASERNIDLKKQPNIMIQKCMFDGKAHSTEEETLDA